VPPVFVGSKMQLKQPVPPSAPFVFCQSLQVVEDPVSPQAVTKALISDAEHAPR
jgi:hypothetical protein